MSSKLKYLSSKCGSGKGVYATSEIKNEIETLGNSHLVVMPTKQLINQFKSDYKEFCDNVKVVVSSDDDFTKNQALLPRIKKSLSEKASHIVMITEKMFYRIEPNLLKDWKVWIDDCNKFCSLIVRGIGSDDQEEILSIYNKIFITSDDYIEISGDENDPVNVKYKSVTINNKINLSDDTKGLYKVYREMSFYHQAVVLGDSLTGKVKQLVVAGWYDLTKYVDAGIDITYMSNDFEKSLLYKRWNHLFEKIDFKLDKKEEFNANDSRIDVKYFFDTTKHDRGLS